MTPAMIWLIVGILLIFSEFLVPGFIIIFFGFGALLAATVAALTDATFIVQGYVFVIASVLLLIIGKRFFKTTLSGKRELSQKDADDDGYVGAVVTVTQAIVPPHSGRVELHGTEWTAVAARPIDVGATVTVTKCENITLTVE